MSTRLMTSGLITKNKSYKIALLFMSQLNLNHAITLVHKALHQAAPPQPSSYTIIICCHRPIHAKAHA